MLKVKKAPGAVLDYAIDWRSDMAGDMITKSAWMVPSGLKKIKDSFAGNVCTVWLAGGRQNARLTVVNRVETAAGRVDERSVLVVIGAK